MPVRVSAQTLDVDSLGDVNTLGQFIDILYKHNYMKYTGNNNDFTLSRRIRPIQ